MAVELREVLSRLSQDPTSHAWALRQLAEVDRAEKAGELSHDLSQTQEFQNRLNRRREEQVARLIALGYHKELDMSSVDYEATLPKIASDLTIDMNRFHSPAIIDPRIPWRRQLELFSAEKPHSRRINLDGAGDIDTLRDTTYQPEVPYVIWARGTRRQSLLEAQHVFVKGEQPITLTEAVCMQVFLTGIGMTGIGGRPGTVAGATEYSDGKIPLLRTDAGMLWILALEPDKGGIYSTVVSRWHQVTYAEQVE